MHRTRMILIGGFLGAGKTTTIGQLARMLTAQGRRVGVITNDQASNLVDTQTLRGAGHEVREVSQACFCCAFPRLIDSADELVATFSSAPLDIILGEPVGSCTDLAATVVQPLKRLYADRYAVTPLLVLVDPHRALDALGDDPNPSLPGDVLYIYRKQLEEADIIAVNKIDVLSAAQLGELGDTLRSRYPQAQVVPISARTGRGLDHLLDLLESPQSQPTGGNIAQVDYDVYAAGEAELGWLNASFTAARPTPFALDILALDLVDELRVRLEQAGAEVAHLKARAEANGSEAVANLVRSGQAAEVSRASQDMATQAEVIVNARVVLDPERLKAIVLEAASAVAARDGLILTWGPARSFRPGRPVPTHRFAEAV